MPATAVPGEAKAAQSIGPMHEMSHYTLLAVLGVATLAFLVVAWLTWQLRRERQRHHEDPPGAHDPLTGLPQRPDAEPTAEELINQAADSGQLVAVIVFNVDRFKAVNGSLGHRAGDELLRALTQRLRRALRRHDLLARLAGDEFTIIAPRLNGPTDAEAVVRKVRQATRAPFAIASLDLQISLSLGVSLYPLDGDSFEFLLRRAELALRNAKTIGSGSYRFYARDMSQAASDALALETDLHRAVANGQLQLHYQPKVDIATGRVRSAEALVRWHHPTRGMVSPCVFIPLAERSGAILEIGEWVLRQACLQVREWIDRDLPPIRIAVNLSAKQFRHADLPAMVRSALHEARLQPGCLELELTESAVMDNPESSAATLQTLSAMGVHLSIDDFGTGYSSLSHLRHFPLDKLKIDRSFVRALTESDEEKSIVKAIVSLAHNLRLGVVAEGVETAEQLDYLREVGCDQYQGFFCSPAVPAEDFLKLLKRLRASLPSFSEADMLKTQSRLSAFTPAR